MRLGAFRVTLQVVPTPPSCKCNMLRNQHNKAQAGLSIRNKPALGFGPYRS